MSTGLAANSPPAHLWFAGPLLLPNECITPGTTIGYDVIVRIGRLRFVEYRQREEIREILRLEHGVTLSSGEVSPHPRPTARPH